ncbi:MAG: carboxypeptidase regulatory-like domain-containing protein, partial [Rubrobacter sp.]|nr:carboxypeptidase regulatory-like domain-containing protein [Rubrobacter sp.]
RGTEEVGTTATDELGEFAFESVPPGEYQILVSSEQVEILISPVELNA